MNSLAWISVISENINISVTSTSVQSPQDETSSGTPGSAARSHIWSRGL